jgi:NADH-quinone oxidoreductase subunit F
VLTPDEANASKLDYESLAAQGTMLGSGAIIVFNKTRNVVTMLRSLSRFYAHESCGQCTPCREGTGYADRIMRSIVNKKGRDSDLGLLLDLCASFTPTTICPLAAADAGPIESFLKKFRTDFEAEIARNPEHAEERLSNLFRPGAYW